MQNSANKDYCACIVRVDVKEIDAETMELLLNYIYTGRVSDFKAVSVVELFKVNNIFTTSYI